MKLKLSRDDFELDLGQWFWVYMLVLILALNTVRYYANRDDVVKANHTAKLKLAESIIATGATVVVSGDSITITPPAKEPKPCPTPAEYPWPDTTQPRVEKSVLKSSE